VIETVDGLFRACLDDDPERVFVRTPTAEVSYAVAALRIAGTIYELRELGYRPQQRIACYVDETLPLLYFWLACSHLGLAPVPVSPTYSTATLAEIAARVGSRAVFAPSHASAVADAGLVALPPLERSMTASQARQLLDADRHDGDAIYAVLPTSGTTGKPKLVVRSHRAHIHGGHHVFARTTLGPNPRIGLLLSLNHVAAHTVTAAALVHGAPMCVPSEVDTAVSLSELRALDPTHFVATPRVLRSLRSQFDGGRWFGPSLRAITSGGAVVGSELFALIESEGVVAREVYGSSETSLLAATEVDPAQARPGYLRVLPGVTVRLADDGELLARSPGRMNGYFEDEDATRLAFDADFYRTGDFAEILDGEWLRIAGRKRDVFNSASGDNIFPSRIEALVEAIPGVDQVVLVGDQRPFLGALIVVTGDVEPVGDNGVLELEAHAARYAELGERIADLNLGLERPEQVRRIRLFGKRFPAEHYAPAMKGGWRRARAELGRRYVADIDRLYTNGYIVRPS
jgi:long-subunit acyl-CoA synthetase (AMP-forming)